MKMLVRPHNPPPSFLYNLYNHKKQTPIDLEPQTTTSTQINQIHSNKTELSRLR